MALAGLGLWIFVDWGFVSGKLTVYYANCEEQGVAPNKCVEINPVNSIDYTVHEERAEVVYLYSEKSEPRKLVNCIIADRRNWKCDHPGLSRPVVVRDGIAKQQIIDGNVIFSVRKWQWWYLKLVGTLPTEIPEQPN